MFVEQNAAFTGLPSLLSLCLKTLSPQGKLKSTWGYYKVLKSNKVLNKNSHYFLRPECAERTWNATQFLSFVWFLTQEFTDFILLSTSVRTFTSHLLVCPLLDPWPFPYSALNDMGGDTLAAMFWGPLASCLRGGKHRRLKGSRKRKPVHFSPLTPCFRHGLCRACTHSLALPPCGPVPMEMTGMVPASTGGLAPLRVPPTLALGAASPCCNSRSSLAFWLYT